MSETRGRVACRKTQLERSLGPDLEDYPSPGRSLILIRQATGMFHRKLLNIEMSQAELLKVLK